MSNNPVDVEDVDGDEEQSKIINEEVSNSTCALEGLNVPT